MDSGSSHFNPFSPLSSVEPDGIDAGLGVDRRDVDLRRRLHLGGRQRRRHRRQRRQLGRGRGLVRRTGRVGGEVADVFDLGGAAQRLHVVGDELALALVAQELLDRRRRLLEVDRLHPRGGEVDDLGAVRANVEDRLAVLHLRELVDAGERQLLGGANRLVACETDVVRLQVVDEIERRSSTTASVFFKDSTCSGVASIADLLEAVDAPLLEQRGVRFVVRRQPPRASAWVRLRPILSR